MKWRLSESPTENPGVNRPAQEHEGLLVSAKGIETGQIKGATTVAEKDRRCKTTARAEALLANGWLVQHEFGTEIQNRRLLHSGLPQRVPSAAAASLSPSESCRRLSAMGSMV